MDIFLLILEVSGWIIASCFLWSIIEYIAHRWVQHSKTFNWIFSRIWESHMLLHHGRFYETFDADDDLASSHVGTELSGTFNVMGSFFIWLPLWFFSPMGAIIFICIAFFHGIVWTNLHIEMHRPEGRWFTHNPYYRYIRNHHKVHHEHMQYNYNAVFPPFADWLFGTLWNKK